MVFWDRPLALFWKSHLPQDIEGFFKTIARLGEGGGWYALAAVAFIGFRASSRLALTTARSERFAAYARAALFLLASMAVSGVVVRVAKFVIGRYRPQGLFAEGLYGFHPFSPRWIENSFPSGHSQTIWAIMIALLLIYPRYDAAYLALAILVSLSRMLTGAHYLSDVVMGSALGILLTVWLHGHFERRGGPVRLSFSRDRGL